MGVADQPSLVAKFFLYSKSADLRRLHADCAKICRERDFYQFFFFILRVAQFFVQYFLVLA